MITREYYLNKVETVIDAVSTSFTSLELDTVEFTRDEVGVYINNISRTSSFSSLIELGIIIFSEYYKDGYDVNVSTMLASISTTSILHAIDEFIPTNIGSAFVNYIYLLMLLQGKSYEVVLKVIQLRLTKLNK